MAGESLFIPKFTANKEPGSVAFSAPYPGKIIPLKLEETGTMLCQRSSFLCAEHEVEVSIALTKKFGAGLFGGEGFILQRLEGKGLTFIHAGGTVLPLDLKAGQSLRVDTGCLVAFQQSVVYDIRMVKGFKNMFLGGEGMFLAHLTGPGRVYLQTLPISRMAGRMFAAAGGGGKSGSALDVVSMITG